MGSKDAEFHRGRRLRQKIGKRDVPCVSEMWDLISFIKEGFEEVGDGCEVCIAP